jgi:alkanesulfonate monooxygenase SsuD/methylene tetrahydromethanopterin reductase-like flavin-dependent oxidoreductase (luciferase family)
MRVYVEINRGFAVETRAVSGTQQECDDQLDHWRREYGGDNLVVVHTEREKEER